MVQTKDTILSALRAHGWQIKEDRTQQFELPPALLVRYPILPQSLKEFLTGLTVCANAEQTAWFLCRDDYHSQSDSSWRWNELELMLLEWADTKQERDEITAFWDRHYPFLLSVRTGYAFFAVNLASGQIVHGLPENGVGETTVIAASFEEFLAQLLAGEFSAEIG